MQNPYSYAGIFYQYVFYKVIFKFFKLSFLPLYSSIKKRCYCVMYTPSLNLLTLFLWSFKKNIFCGYIGDAHPLLCPNQAGKFWKPMEGYTNNEVAKNVFKRWKQFRKRNVLFLSRCAAKFYIRIMRSSYLNFHCDILFPI